MVLRVRVVDDYPVVIAGLTALLAPYRGRVDVVTDPAAAVDIALYDVDGRADLRDLLVDSRVAAVAFSFHTDAAVIEAPLRAGARGHLSMSLGAEAIDGGLERIGAGEQVVLSGERPDARLRMTSAARAIRLSSREIQILRLITRGLSNAEIAELCSLSINTVKTYVRSAYRKIGIATRSQAVAWSMRNGLDISGHEVTAQQQDPA